MITALLAFALFLDNKNQRGSRYSNFVYLTATKGSLKSQIEICRVALKNSPTSIKPDVINRGHEQQK